MRRALSLYLPRWPVDLIRRRMRSGRNAGRREHDGADRQRPAATGHDDPADPVLLVVASQGDRQCVVHGCGQAEAAGVRPGMTLAHARALLPVEAVDVRALDADGDGRALRALAQWAAQFSPTVAPDPPDGLLLDITGCQRLFHGERRLIERIGTSVEHLGFGARIASAPTFGCAWAVARFGHGARSMVGDDDVRAALGPLPVAALRIDAPTRSALAEVGIVCISDLLRLPRSTLPSRFGLELLLQLDRASGRVTETIVPVRPTVPLRAQRLFAGPVRKPEAIARTVHELVAVLATSLAGRECGATGVTAELTRFDNDPVHLAIGLSHPSRDVKHLWALLQPQVERAHLGHGVECIVLTATRTGPLPHHQADDLVPAPPPGVSDPRIPGAALGQLIDVMASRLGPERVARIEPTESHLPEHVFRHWSAVSEAHGRRRPARLVDEDRPSVLFDPPRPVQAMASTPDGPPLCLRWGQSSCRVVVSVGPHRIAPSWWRGGGEADEAMATPGARDYFKVADEHGRWLWVYRDHMSGHWFVHGQWV